VASAPAKPGGVKLSTKVKSVSSGRWSKHATPFASVKISSRTLAELSAFQSSKPAPASGHGVVWSAVAAFLYTLFTWTAAANSSRLCRGGRINTIADPSPNGTYPESL
jgi:hypothetical protein